MVDCVFLGGNINNISDLVSKLGDSRGHIVTHEGTNTLVQRSYGFRNRQYQIEIQKKYIQIVGN